MDKQAIETWAQENGVMMTHYQQTKSWLEFDVCCIGHAIQLNKYLTETEVDFGFNGIHFFLRNETTTQRWDIIEEEFQKAGFFTHPIEDGLEVASPEHDVWDDEVRQVLFGLNLLAFINVAMVETGGGHIFCRLGAI